MVLGVAPKILVIYFFLYLFLNVFLLVCRNNPCTNNQQLLQSWKHPCGPLWICFCRVFFFLLRDILKKYAHVVVFLRKFWNSYRKYINIFLKNANLDNVVSGSSSAKSRAEFCLLGTIPTRMTVLPQHSARAGWDDGRINNCMCLWYFYRRIQINTVLPDLYLIWIYLKIV